MEILIRKLDASEIGRGLSLISDMFQEFVAPDYSDEGIETFHKEFIDNESFIDKFRIGRQVMYGAFLNAKLVGVISYSTNNKISCIFVHKDYHRKGIATMLLETVISDLRNRNVKTITLNASPYGEPFYLARGFVPTDTRLSYRGIIYTPMELHI